MCTLFVQDKKIQMRKNRLPDHSTECDRLPLLNQFALQRAPLRKRQYVSQAQAPVHRLLLKEQLKPDRGLYTLTKIEELDLN